MKSSIFCLEIDVVLVWISLNLAISASSASFPVDEIDIYGNIEWPCLENATCTTPQSFCGGYLKCQCPTGYIFNAAMTACLEVATAYGVDCVETSQCLAYLSIGGKCSDGICQCDTGYHYLHGRCYKSSGFGEKCKSDDDCNVNGDFEALSCTDGMCGCSKGFYQREYRTCRREANAIGAECTIDLDCRFDKRAKCDLAKGCYLKAESERNNVENTMSNHVEWNAPIPQNSGAKLLSESDCTTDQHCAKYGPALCTATGHCICKRGFAFDSSRKSCRPELGEKCDPKANVTIPNSICRDARWSCKGARVASTNHRQCLKAMADAKSICQYDEQCYTFGPDSKCVDSHCGCTGNSHYVEDEMFCWRNRELGESCNTNKDCHVPNFRSQLICNDSFTCECPVDTHLNFAGTACMDDIPTLGALCSADVDCISLSNAHCRNERCTCLDSYFESSGVCVAGINASCATDHDCKSQNSECLSHICTCTDGHVSPSPDLCVPVSAFNDECQYDVQCSATVADARCVKPETSELFESRTPRSSSLNGTCNCGAGHHKKYQKCYPSKVLDETCHSRGECYVTSDPDSVQCLRGVCTCDFDAERINSTFCQNDASTTVAISSLLIPSILFVTAFAW